MPRTGTCILQYAVREKLKDWTRLLVRAFLQPLTFGEKLLWRRYISAGYSDIHLLVS